MSEIEAFETHMDRMERERQAQDAALEIEKELTRRAKIKARTETKETITWIFGMIITAVVVLGAIFFIWKGTAGPNADQELEREARIECVQSGGTFIPNVGGDSRGSDICIVEGQSVDK